jgi:hypothetical protein
VVANHQVRINLKPECRCRTPVGGKACRDAEIQLKQVHKYAVATPSVSVDRVAIFSWGGGPQCN